MPEPRVDEHPSDTAVWTGGSDAEALQHLRMRMAEGSHWFTALLETVAMWRAPFEDVEDHRYTYLIGGEAFDWLTLAERLMEELGDAVPDDEREALLFTGRVPADVGPWEFQRLLGRAKYRAHLNFWYGVTVEEALLVAVEERLAKERGTIGFRPSLKDYAPVYEWVYGQDLHTMLGLYWEARQLPPSDTMTLTQLREFTYWCFKYRVAHRDPAKVASDTRLGVNKLQQLYTRYGRHPLVF